MCRARVDASRAPARADDGTAEFFPMAVWYGGGKARAPMLEGQARSKKDVWRADIRQIKSLGRLP